MVARYVVLKVHAAEQQLYVLAAVCHEAAHGCNLDFEQMPSLGT